MGVEPAEKLPDVDPEVLLRVPIDDVPQFLIG
jgi:hypothetical protein